MPAEVESMMYVSNEENNRFVPWHGLGTPVEHALTSEEALVVAGLDWEVNKKSVFDERGLPIHGYYRTCRSTDDSTFGIVGDRYKVVQNREAFSFTDNLIGGEVRYETAGSLRGGRRIWLLARLPETEILGDKFDNYVCFTNTHDGTGSVKACMTPVRVVCNNTLNLALSGAQRRWSTRHIGDLQGKLEEGRRVLELAALYEEQLRKEAEKLVEIRVDEATIEHLFDVVFPVDRNKDTERKINNVEYLKQKFFNCLAANDIKKFDGTAWQVINATTDFVDHTPPVRNTESYRENNWASIIDGHSVVDAMHSLLLTGAAV